MSRLPVLVLLAFAALVAGCGSSSKKTTTAATQTAPAISVKDVAYPGKIFSYDRLTALDLHDNGVVNPGYPIAVHDISYADPRGGRPVTGYLVVPPGGGKHPGIVYLHGSGGDRTELLVQATWMAARGAVCLLIDSAETRAGDQLASSGMEAFMQQRDLEDQNISDLRRAIDVLISLRYVDPHRLGYVGWSAGAKSGAILAGVDHRIRSFSLLSGGSDPVSAYTRLAPKAQRAALAALLSQTDPLRYIAHAAPSALLIQDGLKDEIVPHRALVRLADAASEPKDVRWYRSKHAPSSKVWHDQLRWMAKRLGLKGPIVPGAKTGP
jgi:dienelactone hydrolase